MPRNGQKVVLPVATDAVTIASVVVFPIVDPEEAVYSTFNRAARWGRAMGYSGRH